MSQNTSTAVMQRRQTKKADASLDHFPTPPWATRALCEWLARFDQIGLRSCLEPACAEGHMSRALGEYFSAVRSTDVADYGFGEVQDFLWPNDLSADWIITNPPFILARDFALVGLEKSTHGVALIVRSAFVEGQARFAELFSVQPPSDILQFVERVAMVKGRLDREASSATAYCWLVWRKDSGPGTRFHWLSPCRRRLERDSDYPEVAA